MKIKKSLVLLLSLLMSMTLFLAACTVSEKRPTYSDELKNKIGTAIQDGVDMALLAVLGMEEVPDEMKGTIDPIVTQTSEKLLTALADGGITETEVNKLLNIEVEFDENMQPDPFALFDEFKATGINGTKIGKFMWSLVVSVEDVVKSVDSELFPLVEGTNKSYKDLILDEYDKALGCITEAEFNTIVSGLIDYSITSLDSLLEVSEMITDMGADAPTLAEFKSIINESKASTERLNTLLSDKFLNATASVIKKAAPAYGMVSASDKTAFNTSVDKFVGYVNVLKKVDLAIANAIDNNMIEALYGAIDTENLDTLTVVVGKLINKAIDTSANGTGTGLTKSFIKNLDLAAIETIVEIPDLKEILNDEIIDQLFADAAYFADLGYDATELDENNLIVQLFSLSDAEKLPPVDVEK